MLAVRAPDPARALSQSGRWVSSRLAAWVCGYVGMSVWGGGPCRSAPNESMAGAGVLETSRRIFSKRDNSAEFYDLISARFAFVCSARGYTYRIEKNKPRKHDGGRVNGTTYAELNCIAQFDDIRECVQVSWSPFVCARTTLIHSTRLLVRYV